MKKCCVKGCTAGIPDDWEICAPHMAELERLLEEEYKVQVEIEVNLELKPKEPACVELHNEEPEQS